MAVLIFGEWESTDLCGRIARQEDPSVLVRSELSHGQ